VLTDQGRALLDNARAVAGDLDRFKARAKRLAGGLEPELSVAVDVMFPVATFTGAVAAFQKEFPATLLRFDIESSAVIEPVLDRRCAIGVVGSWALAPPQLTHEPLLTISTHTVVAAQHPLATQRGQIPLSILADAHRSVRYFARLRTPSQDPESLVPFPPRGQACISARGIRVWRLASACYRGGPCERRAR
jgi:DNA-binding transcriptional LysR family regulator